MLLYNITFGVDKDIAPEWLVYMREYYIPEVMKTGLFADAKVYKVLHDEDEGTISYSVQYFASRIEHINQYLDLYAPRFMEEHRKKFANKHVAFQTLLEEV